MSVVFKRNLHLLNSPTSLSGRSVHGIAVCLTVNQIISQYPLASLATVSYTCFLNRVQSSSNSAQRSYH